MNIELKKTLKQDWPLWLLFAGMLIAALVLYPQMPDRVPSHWNARGEIDGYLPRFSGTFLIPLMNVGLYVIFLVLPKIDPRRANYQYFTSSYNLIRYALHLFMAGLFALTAAAALGYAVQVSRLVPVAVALLLIVLGFALRKVRHNYFVGFRVPWTLASETVWDKTHRVGSTLMMMGGALYLISSFFPALAQFPLIFMICVLGPVFVTLVYSYWVFRQEQH